MGETSAIKVLVVDDHVLLSESLVRVLRDEDGIEVVGTAGTVEQAVASAQAERPDVILMDYELPDGDGAKATEMIKSELPQIQVVMLTGLGDEKRLIEAIEAGCSGFMTKDKAVSEVVDAVRAVHAGEALISSALLGRLLPRLRRTSRGVGSDLTARELEILKLLATGLSNRQLAEALFISPNTARNHVQNVLTKLGAHSKLEAVATAVREDIIRFP